jgi:hypothetical protein
LGADGPLATALLDRSVDPYGAAAELVRRVAEPDTS